MQYQNFLNTTYTETNPLSITYAKYENIPKLDALISKNNKYCNMKQLYKIFKHIIDCINMLF